MPIMDHIERENYIGSTGEWWFERWWEETGYQDSTSFSLEETNRAIDCVKNMFDSRWFLKNHKDHPFSFYLKCKGTMFLVPLVSFGLDLDIVLKHKHLIGDLSRRLKQKDQFDGARFELSLLAHLIKQNLNIVRDPKTINSNKNCDFCIKNNDETIYLELKNLNVSEANREREFLFLKFSTDLMRNIQSHPFDFHFTDEYRNFLHTKEGIEYFRNKYDEIQNTIISSIKSSADKDELGEHQIKDIGTFLIDPPDSRKCYDIDLRYRSPHEEVSKFISNAIKEAKEQLIEPGVLLIKYPYVVNDEVCRPILKFFIDNGADYKNISQVIIVYETLDHNGLSKTKYYIRIIKNHHAVYISDTTILKSLNCLFFNNR